ncbi:MAG: hypothetical protein IKA87_05445 [Lentisphaeria bacterium]|nr:hypothetical protein [Lentisphaeria bacterium]
MNQITSLRNGTVVNRFYGKEENGVLYLPVSGIADEDAFVTVNGVAADRSGAVFSAVVPVSEKFTEITMTAENSCGRMTHSVKVVFDRDSFPRYNFFIDDNSFFWTDIIRNKPRSLFDHFYLEFLESMHRKYGTKFTLNLFYRNDHEFCELKDFPESYKGEFSDNADWLRMSWHAYSEFPDRPYQNAAAEKVASDYDLIKSEVCRFAGEQSFIPPVAAHWSMIRPDGMAELVKRGVKVMTSQFINPKTSLEEAQRSSHLCDIGFFQNLRESLYLSQKHLLYDFNAAILYLRGTLICNYWTPERIIDIINSTAGNAALRHEILSLETHEQYTFPNYFNYLPDHMERMETAIRRATELGYEPVWFAEGLLGNDSWGK